jgi:hypothetical protein
MRAIPWRWSALVCCLLPAGCGGVREDRSINWDADGRQVAFQHGREGVFLADRDGGGLRRIFQPPADAVAVSAPLWEPYGRRVLFAAARLAEPPKQLAPGRRSEDDPAGNLHFQRPVVYTCWLCADDGEGKPRSLFEARCDHEGYVAANLAAAWHPRGNAILYVDQVGEHRHSLFAYDLESGRSRRVAPFDAEALVFDWSPDGSRLACRLGGRTASETDGLWVGRPGMDGWRRIADSQEPPPSELFSTLERLRVGRPVWTPDGARLAFVSYTPGRQKDEPGRYHLRAASPTTGEAELLAEGTEPIRDIRWSPDGSRLGFVRGGDDGVLCLLRPGAAARPAGPTELVRRLAGWDARGERLAWVAPDALPGDAEGTFWAFLMRPDPQARDSIHVADGAGKGPGETVFSGMRVTFARWSPTEEKLSLWATFTPTHRSLTGAALGGGLRPGDPAAVFDLKTQEMKWMPISPDEKVQVGHYHLLKRQYAEAWRWYEEAERDAAKPEARPAANPPEATHPGCFHWYCLTKLGRPDEARTSLEEFRAAYPPRLARELAERPPANDAERWLREQMREGSLPFHLRQESYLAEMFLSLDALEDGEAFFREALAEGGSDEARLSRALALSQLLLLRRRYADYAELATETAAPLLLRALAASDAAQGGLVLLAVAPLAVPEFLAELPPDRVAALLPRWRRLREAATSDRDRYGADLVLLGLCERLGREQERAETAARLQRNGKAAAGMPTPEDLRNWGRQWRETQRAPR